MKTNILNTKKFVVIDLYAGSYNRDNTGHELFNLTKNPLDGNYYGYCPPRDGIAIKKLGASNNDTFIDDVLIVYVSKKKNSSDREIIAFCLNARVYKTGQSGDQLFRFFPDKNGQTKVATYSVVSDNLFDLKNRKIKFEIKISAFNKLMFRRQRFYPGKYPILEKDILEYIESIIENRILLDNDDIEQEEIQKVESASAKELKNSIIKPPSIVNGSQGKIISKDSRISKAALNEGKYTCIIDSNHTTFKTKYKKQYMEGHHLIPCTVNNSEHYFQKFGKNIDCKENIVCICPNCHREVHYGEWKSKSKMIKLLFAKQQNKLRKVGLTITEKELLNLYKSK
jgi:5-methylcytosine-specific restriction protein A